MSGVPFEPVRGLGPARGERIDLRQKDLQALVDYPITHNESPASCYAYPMNSDHDRRRFWSRVAQWPGGCWGWTGGTRENGYGSFAIRRPGGAWTQTTSQRWSYEDLVGPIPPLYEVDHLCRVRGCVRPDHLEAITLQENRHRRDVKYAPLVDREVREIPVIPPRPAPPAKRNPLTHCLNGHVRAEAGIVKNGSGVTCRTCRDEQAARKRKGGAHGTETHCPAGHPYSPENTYLRQRPGGGNMHRECRACIRARSAAHYAMRSSPRDPA